jgi:hypothetical protein
MSLRHTELKPTKGKENFLINFIRIFSIFLIVIIFSSWRYANAQDWQRGFKNYQEITQGKKKFEQLSPQERQEVLVIHRRIQAAQANSGASSDCRDARNRAESAASDLADYARRLRNCAEAQNFSDDCSSEFRRTRSAHSDYEDAISSVSNYCR